mmetsp:Transcript_38372/g.87489  ORF Transcript_38372/g.87489 Transcript_38372/m.87489 type:complete len:313 (+) Transcript_38372:331-1269(+)
MEHRESKVPDTVLLQRGDRPLQHFLETQHHRLHPSGVLLAFSLGVLAGAHLDVSPRLRRHQQAGFDGVRLHLFRPEKWPEHAPAAVGVGPHPCQHPKKVGEREKSEGGRENEADPRCPQVPLSVLRQNSQGDLEEEAQERRRKVGERCPLQAAEAAVDGRRHLGREGEEHVGGEGHGRDVDRHRHSRADVKQVREDPAVFWDQRWIKRLLSRAHHTGEEQSSHQVDIRDGSDSSVHHMIWRHAEELLEERVVKVEFRLFDVLHHLRQSPVDESSNARLPVQILGRLRRNSPPLHPPHLGGLAPLFGSPLLQQ